MRSWAHLLHITRDRQMVQLHNLWDSLESLLEVGNLPSRLPSARSFARSRQVTNLLEVVTQLDDWGGIKHTGFIQDELTMLERVDIALDQQQVRATLHRQESTPRNIDAVRCHVNKRSAFFLRTEWPRE